MQRSDGLFSALAEVSRRDFMKLCTALAATMGLSSKAGAEMTAALTEPKRPPVLWIGAQECTGCTESLLRATHPTVENLVLEMISLEYHETLSAAFGEQAEDGKQSLQHEAALELLCHRFSKPRATRHQKGGERGSYQYYTVGALCLSSD